MSKSLLKMLEKLEFSSSEFEKTSTSNEILDFVLVETEFSEELIKNHLLGLLKNHSSFNFHHIMNGEFFKSRLKAYYDDNGSLRIAFGIAFLQDLNSFDSCLENDIIFLIDKIIKTIKLDLIVNDITVNTLQIRNGDLVGSDFKG